MRTSHCSRRDTFCRWHLTRLAFAFLVQSVQPPPIDSLPHPSIARLSPFVNCFRLTDWWMNRSIDLMHMYRYYMSTFYRRSFFFFFLYLYQQFVFSFSRIFVHLQLPCSRRSSEVRKLARREIKIETFSRAKIPEGGGPKIKKESTGRKN